MDTKERKTGVVRTPARRPRRTRSGARHTALAAKIEVEKRKRISRGAKKNCSTEAGLVSGLLPSGIQRLSLTRTDPRPLA
jgi:hypothetical protein